MEKWICILEMEENSVFPKKVLINKWLYVIMAWPFGGVGCHKFITGKIRSGAFY